MALPVTLDDIRAAHTRISSFVLRTPLLSGFALPVPEGIDLWLKAENLQRTSSFKIRGAYNAIAGLSEEERARGVITYSSGNHGQAVACAAHLLNTPAVVVMPEDAISLKVESTRHWGARIEFAGLTSLSRRQRALDLVAEHGYVVIPPFDDLRIIAGQGTVGVEIMEALPDVDTVVAQIGGGGLMSGIASAVKAIKPSVRVVGVEPEGAADVQDSLREGQPVTWDNVSTVADGLRTSRVGDLNFEVMRSLVDDVVTVSEGEILRVTGLLADRTKLVVEPSGAVATAAVLAGKAGKGRIAAVLSGGNIDPVRLQDCLRLVTEQPIAQSA